MNKKYNAEDWKDRIIEAIDKTDSMTQAYQYLGLERKTFIKMAKELNLYKPNQGLKGVTKNIKYKKKDLKDILVKNSNYESHKLKLRLIEEGIKENKCEKCGLTKWMNVDLSLQLHHIDGDHHNNELDNLQILCPNCHSITDNYTSKNKKVNSYNINKIPTSESGFLGVMRGKQKGKYIYRAVITDPNTKLPIQLGYTFNLDSEEDKIRLAKLYDKKAIELYGDDISTNKKLGLY
jgi:Zn finger protein HypA/HybF involved in hydrogenase expression